MRNLLYLTILLLTQVTLLFGQEYRRDSLLRLLPKTQEDTAKVLLLCAIGEAFENVRPDTAKHYLRQAGALSRKINYARGEYKYLYLYGNVFLLQGNYDSSLYYQQQALQQAYELNDSLSIGVSLFNIGINYREMSSYEKAIDYCLQGRKIIDRYGDAAIQMQVDDALQVLYHNRAQYDKAIAFGDKAIALARKAKAKEPLARYLINSSLSYQSTKQLQKAVLALEEALQIGQELNDTRILSVIQQNLAGVALNQRNYPLFRKYATESLRLSRQLGAKEGETRALRSLAIGYLQEGRLAQAKQYALQALALSRQWQYKLEEVSTHRLLSGIAYAENDYEQGLNYDDTMTHALETMVSEVMSAQSADLEKKYETEKKESRIKQLEAEKTVQELRIKQKNTINYLLIGGGLTFMVIAFLSWRNYRQKQILQQKKINELQTEKQLAATEAVLKGEEQERTRLAKDLHDGLGGMLSGIKYSFNTMKGNLVMNGENLRAFERGIEMLDSSINEMRRVAHNLMPEALVKFGLDTALRDFCNDIRLSGSLRLQYQSSGLEKATIGSNTAISVYRIVQELVNNIMKHAGATSALVQLIHNESGITITVEDDGKGFDTALLGSSKGMGWSNIYRRVDYLDGKMDIQSTPHKGTSVLIELPAL